MPIIPWPEDDDRLRDAQEKKKTAEEVRLSAMSPFCETVFETAQTLTNVSQEAFRQGVEQGRAEIAAKQIARLEAALRPFVVAYVEAADEIGDSDLYPEQPRSVSVTLGDCRKARMALRDYYTKGKS